MTWTNLQSNYICQMNVMGLKFSIFIWLSNVVEFQYGNTPVENQNLKFVLL